MPGGEQLLIRIAFDLWTSKGIVGIWEIAPCLDQPGFERVLAALRTVPGRIPDPIAVATRGRVKARR